MGCTPTKTVSKSKLVKQPMTKLNPRQVSTLSRNSTINSQAPNEKILLPKIQSCLKLSLPPVSPTCARNQLDFYKTQLYHQSQAHSTTYNKIRFLYSILSSDLQDFYNGCHQSCQTKPDFSQSLRVFMISIQLNENIDYKIMKRPPYIQINGQVNEGTQSLWGKWNNLMNSIKVVLENDTDEFRAKVKELGKFLKTVDEYSEFVLKPMKLLRASKYLKSALDTIFLVFKQANELEKMILKGLNENGMKKVMNEVKLRKGLKDYTGENIVHFLC